MRKTFLYLIGGQLAAFSLPAFAQDTAPDGADAAKPEAAAGHTMTPEQMAQVETWPADKQTAFRQWPGEVQTYFWQLPAERQDIFWRLQDKDKITLSGMDEAGRTAAWARIDAQLAAQAPAGGTATTPPPADTGAPPADAPGTPPPATTDTPTEETPEQPEPMSRG